MRRFFADARSAVRWACTVEGSAGRPLSARMLDRERPGGDDWTETATQAGIIWRALKPLSGAPVATLVARAAPRTVPCRCRRPCCAGHRITPIWHEAIEILCAAALAAGLACKRYDERRALLIRAYGDHRKNNEIADELGIEEHTLGQHAKHLELWVGARGKEGIEPQAWSKATDLLTAAGILGEANAPEAGSLQNR